MKSGYTNKNRNKTYKTAIDRYGPDCLLNTEEAAEYLGISASSLSIWRQREKNNLAGNPKIIPQTTHIGKTGVRYMVRHLKEYVKKCKERYGND